ncbi:MAG: hypothetical protein QNJ97_05625 [Myxococcota bacterium]|nr:hypothetical protein [Myxococcota bacterium]
MVKRYSAGGALLIGVMAALMIGCGGAEKPQKKAFASGSEAPFGGVGDTSELKGSGGGAASTEDTGTSYDATDIRIPGSDLSGNTKKKNKKQRAAKAKKCPKGKKGKKCRARNRKSKGIPYSEKIKDQTSGIAWGMHYKAVMAKFENIIKDSYKEELKNAGGAIEEDRVRTKMIREINNLRNSYVKFDGDRSGYEGVMIEPEFTHNNGESMLMWDAGKFVEYLFFFDGRFWKRLRSFRRDSLEDKITFEGYVEKLTSMFGKGKEIQTEDGKLDEVKWQDDDTYMIARDRSNFYGVYCLVLSAKVTENNLASLRTNQPKPDGYVTEKVSDVVADVTGGNLSDTHTSVVDSYTGESAGGSSGGHVGDTHHSVTKGSGKKQSGKKTKEKAGKPIKEDEEGVDDLF